MNPLLLSPPSLSSNLHVVSVKLSNRLFKLLIQSVLDIRAVARDDHMGKHDEMLLDWNLTEP